MRTGPKVYYCLRDLKHTSPWPALAARPHLSRLQPGPGKRRSRWAPRWAGPTSIPSTYHEQWIDVTGLRGCFAYVHRADPENHIFESNETNNDSQRIVRLPFGRSHKKCG